MPKALLVATVSLCFVLVAGRGSAYAQATDASAGAANRTEEAKGLFAAGRAAFDAGRYADALEDFERSYAISHRAALLFNIGLAHDRLREDDKALAAYDAYLAAVPAAENRTEVETRAGAIRAALARRSENEPAPAAAAAPTPAQTAASAPQPAAQPTNAATQSDASVAHDEGLLTKWWFWTAVGVVVAGGVTAGVVAAGSGGDDKATTLAPKSGVIVTTLRGAR